MDANRMAGYLERSQLAKGVARSLHSKNTHRIRSSIFSASVPKECEFGIIQAKL